MTADPQIENERKHFLLDVTDPGASVLHRYSWEYGCPIEFHYAYEVQHDGRRVYQLKLGKIARRIKLAGNRWKPGKQEGHEILIETPESLTYPFTHSRPLALFPMTKWAKHIIAACDRGDFERDYRIEHFGGYSLFLRSMGGYEGPLELPEAYAKWKRIHAEWETLRHAHLAALKNPPDPALEFG